MEERREEEEECDKGVKEEFIRSVLSLKELWIFLCVASIERLVSALQNVHLLGGVRVHASQLYAVSLRAFRAPDLRFNQWLDDKSNLRKSAVEHQDGLLLQERKVFLIQVVDKLVLCDVDCRVAGIDNGPVKVKVPDVHDPQASRLFRTLQELQQFLWLFR